METNIKIEESEDPPLKTDLAIEEAIAIEIEIKVIHLKPTNLIINSLLSPKTSTLVTTSRIIR